MKLVPLVTTLSLTPAQAEISDSEAFVAAFGEACIPERLGYELYRDGAFIYRAPEVVTPYTAENVMRIMCAQGREAQTFVDHRAARAAATAHFAQSGS